MTTASDVFIQWKGTDVCLDFHCYACNTFAHVDADFAYHIKCPTCGQMYEMPSVVALKPVDAAYNECVVTAEGAEQDLRETGWAAAIPLGTAQYHSDRHRDKG